MAIDSKNTRGVFSLEEVREVRTTTGWPDKAYIWTQNVSPPGTSTNVGYISPGAEISSPISSYSNYQKIDFANDTATATNTGSSFTQQAQFYYYNSLSSLSHTYTTSAGYSLTYRLDHSNDTGGVTSVGNLAYTVSEAAAVGNRDYGYIAGGNTPSETSSTTRIDYSSDSSTSSPKGPLSLGVVSRAVGAGNQSYGYVYGGNMPPGYRSYSQRIDYSSDTSATSPKGLMSVARGRGIGAISNADYGYAAGGLPGPVSTVDRMDFASDSTNMVTKGPLPNARWGLMSTGNDDYGYIVAGRSPAGSPNQAISSYERIDYSNDTPTLSPRGNLVTTLTQGSGAGPRINANNSPVADEKPRSYTGLSDYGYAVGGLSPSALSSYQRMDYANDTSNTTTKGNLSVAKGSLAAFTSATGSYAGGGAEPTLNSTVDRLDLSSDTGSAVVKAPLPSGAQQHLTGYSNRDSGYFVGGNSGTPYTSQISRIDFSNDNINQVASLSEAKAFHDGLSNQHYGYSAYGAISGGTNVSSIERFDFSNDTSGAVKKANNPIIGTYTAATGNSTYGYFIGVRLSGGPHSSYVTRLTFDNDTSNTIYRGNLSEARNSGNGFGNENFGYIIGGIVSSSYVSSARRIDYSNDLVTSQSKGNMALGASGYGRGVGLTKNQVVPTPLVTNVTEERKSNNSYGYCLGGGNNDPRNNYQRIDFSNDTATATRKGSFNVKHSGVGAVCNTTNAWVMGSAANPSGVYKTIIERMSFDNDTSTASYRASLGQHVSLSAAIGNVTYGYQTGGYNGSSPVSLVQRLTLASDLTNTSNRGPLVSARYGIATVGNQSYGYVCGGREGTPIVNKVDRIDYSNDSPTASPKGTLSTGLRHPTGAGNDSYGWIGGGVVTSLIQRIDYSNDTNTAVNRAFLGQGADYSLSATGNGNFGYWMCGASAPTACSRLTYASDTTNSSPRGNMVYGASQAGGASSTENGMPQ